MADQELSTFIADVRAKATAVMVRLATVDPDSISPELWSECDAARAGWKSLLAMTEDDVIALHLAPCEHAGRELTPAELQGLLTRDPAGKQGAWLATASERRSSRRSPNASRPQSVRALALDSQPSLV